MKEPKKKGKVGRPAKLDKALPAIPTSSLRHDSPDFKGIGSTREDGVRNDGWANLAIGLGGKMDKQRNTHFDELVLLDRDEQGRMYVGDGLGRKIVDVVADDMTREWVNFGDEEEDEENNKRLTAILDTLSVEKIFNAALKWQRLYGGGVIVIGAMDGNPLDVPMEVNKVRSIEWLKTVDMWDIDLPSSIWDRDPMSPTFGQIQKYMCQFRLGGIGYIQRMHVDKSRIIEFKGDPIPVSIQLADQRLRYWGASCLQSIWEQVRNMGGSMSAISNLLYELVIGKYKFENLGEMLAAGQESRLITRMEIINMSKSVINAVMLGKEEDYTRDTVSLAGVADILDRFMMLVSGTSGIPVSRLFGRSAAGLNATGEGDTTNYYDMVRAKQKTDLKPAITQFVGLVCKVYGLNLPEIAFNPLQQRSDKEVKDIAKTEAETRKIDAETDKIYIDAGVASPEEIADNRGYDFIPPPDPEEFGLPDMTGEDPTDPEAGIPVEAGKKGEKDPEVVSGEDPEEDEQPKKGKKAK